MKNQNAKNTTEDTKPLTVEELLSIKGGNVDGHIGIGDIIMH